MSYEDKVFVAFGSQSRCNEVLEIAKEIGRQCVDDDSTQLQMIEAIIIHPGLKTEFERLWIAVKLHQALTTLYELPFGAFGSGHGDDSVTLDEGT